MNEAERKNMHDCALRRARAAYDERNDIVTVQMRVRRIERDAWRDAAASRGLSFTAFVRDLIARSSELE